MADGLGKPFYIESPGIGLKKYPSCYHTHRALDGVFQLLGEHRLSDKDIAEVDVGTSERAMRVLAFSEPATPYQAKFSMPHCIAAAVVDHQVTLATFTDRKFEDRNIVESEKEGSPFFPRRAHLAGPRGRRSGYRVRRQSGDDPDDGWAKLQRTRGYSARRSRSAAHRRRVADRSTATVARSQLRPDDIERSVGVVLGLEKVADIGTLMASLAVNKS